MSIELPEQFNVADHLILPNLTPERADKVFMYCLDETLTFRQLHERSNQAGNALRRLGVTLENRVLLLMLESLSFPTTFFGAMRLGAVPVPVNTLLGPKDYLYYITDSRARIVVVDEALWPQIEPIEKDLKYKPEIVIANGSVPGKRSLDDLVAAESTELETEMLSPDDAAFWLYTSGSTGSPKAAVHLHHDIVFSNEHFGGPFLQLKPGDLTFSAAKFFFAYGLGNSLYIPLAVGASSVVNPGRPTPEAVFEVLQKFRPKVFYGVPTLFNGMVNTYEAWQRGEGDPPAEIPTLDHLEFSVSAGESLPEALYKRWQTHFGSEILDGIGSTEMLHIYICNKRGKIRPGSTGQVVEGYEAKLVDEKGQPVGDNQIGALLVRGDSAAAYYWNKHEKTKATMQGEWLVTGDQFHRDSDGYYWYEGRNDDMMKVSGSWVSPMEIENALLGHPAVMECAVVGKMDEAGLNKPKAFVVLKSGQSPSDEMAESMIEHVKGSIASFKAPAWVEFASDLPKTATGKIRRFQLRDPA